MTHPTVAGVIRLAELRSTDLDPAEVLAAVEDPRAGGIDVFVGLVRDHDQERAVDHLEYSAHPRATDELRMLLESVAAAHDVIALAAVHRTGSLAIGDVAVVVAVAAAHRGSAFDATRVLIDRLKTEVPIWKHQVYADGSEEWLAHA